jgi:hypothetical protein
MREGAAPPPPDSNTYVAFRPAAFTGTGAMTGAGTDGFYQTLSDAIGAAPPGTEANPDVIVLVDDAPVSGPINLISGQYIRLTSPTDTISIKRNASGFGSLITVANGATLELGGNLVIDGNRDGDAPGGGDDISANAALITVNGTLTMGGSVKLRNNNNPSTNGGGVYVNSGGTFTMSGSAVISSNTATSTATYSGGGGVYSTGTTLNPSYFFKTGGTIYGGGGSGTNNASDGPVLYIKSGGSISSRSNTLAPTHIGVLTVDGTNSSIGGMFGT